jgi:hypothetical protein
VVSVKLEDHLIKHCVWLRLVTFFDGITIFPLFLLSFTLNPLTIQLIAVSSGVLCSLLLPHHLLTLYTIFSMMYKLRFSSRTLPFNDFNHPLELFKIPHFCLYCTSSISINYRKYFALNLWPMISPLQLVHLMNCLLYADDVALIANKYQIVDLLQICEEHSLTLGYRWNSNKCAILDNTVDAPTIIC